MTDGNHIKNYDDGRRHRRVTNPWQGERGCFRTKLTWNQWLMMLMARQRDRVDVNGEYIGIGSNLLKCVIDSVPGKIRGRWSTAAGVAEAVAVIANPTVGSARVVRPVAAAPGRCVRRSGAGLVVVVVVKIGLSRSPAEDFTRRDRIALLTGIGSYQSLFALGIIIPVQVVASERKNLICKD